MSFEFCVSSFQLNPKPGTRNPKQKMRVWVFFGGLLPDTR